MNNFGLLKSKIEKILVESYSDKKTLKENFKTFKSLVLENKSLAKLYWLYDELKNKRGLDSSIVNDYINECVNQFKNISKGINSKSVEKLNEWVKGVESENDYSDIDNLFSDNILTIEAKILSKNKITESLKRKITKEGNKIELPLSVMVNVANKTIDNYINQLSEDDKNKLTKFLSRDSDEMKKDYITIKEDVINKLKTIQNSSDDEVSSRINETIQKIENEKFDKLNYFRLEQLSKSI
jgi:hypothetical protein